MGAESNALCLSLTHVCFDYSTMLKIFSCDCNLRLHDQGSPSFTAMEEQMKVCERVNLQPTAPQNLCDFCSAEHAPPSVSSSVEFVNQKRVSRVVFSNTLYSSKLARKNRYCMYIYMRRRTEKRYKSFGAEEKYRSNFTVL